MLSQLAGIYYDNPECIVNKDECRSVIGWVVNDGEVSKIKQFLEANPDFSMA
jgi:hypothetical protein